MEKRKKQGGKSGFVLCNKCNNDTGAWYGNAYIDFVKALAEFATPNAKGTLEIELHGVYPLRVIKQVLAMMCGSCGPGLSEEHPILKNLILGKEFNGRPGRLRIFSYLLTYPGGRSTGKAGILDSRGTGKVVAEVSWWPVGWIMAFDDQTEIPAFDLTHFCNFGYDEKTSVVLNLPCYCISTGYPLDFRTPEQVIEEGNK